MSDVDDTSIEAALRDLPQEYAVQVAAMVLAGWTITTFRPWWSGNPKENAMIYWNMVPPYYDPRRPQDVLTDNRLLRLLDRVKSLGLVEV